MIVTQPALLCLASFWNNLFGRAIAHAPEAPPAASTRPASPPAAAVERAAAVRLQRLEAAIAPETLLAEPIQAKQDDVASRDVELVQEVERTMPEVPKFASGSGPLTANERRARATALRALAFSRARHFDAARVAFQDAATLDPALDLTRVPTFWTLERAAHEAAIAAYVAADRAGDAAVLRAKVHSVYRPKPVRPRGANARSYV